MVSAIGSYITALRGRPLRFWALDRTRLGDGSQLHRYRLQSQSWPAATPRLWEHQLDLLLPARPRPGPALLLANNRSPFPCPQDDQHVPAAPDFDADHLSTLQQQTGAVVLSLAQLPNQPLHLPGERAALSEDELVAACWRAYLANPREGGSLPLQVPMTAALGRAIDLWEHLQGARQAVIIAGLSKRAGAAWLTAMHDARVVALASFGLDIHYQAVLAHIQAVYQGQWPEALAAYQAAGITECFRSPAFARLMGIIDPWAQRDQPEGARLVLPKLIVNAGGDDFFPPDCPALYVPDLPGPLYQQTLANCDHAGIRRHVADSLAAFAARIRDGRRLPPPPEIIGRPARPTAVVLPPGEMPVRLRYWHAHAPQGRDFRYSRGVRYLAADIAPLQARIAWPGPPDAVGWHASYLDLHYADGWRQSTPVSVSHHR